MIVELHTELALATTRSCRICRIFPKHCRGRCSHAVIIGRPVLIRKLCLQVIIRIYALSHNCDIDHQARPPAKLDFMNLIKLTQKC